MTGQTVAHPIGVTGLPEGMHACQDCGLPVTGLTTECNVFGRQRPDGLGGMIFLELTGAMEFGLCESCAARRVLARTIVDTIPALRAYGDPRFLHHRLSLVLVAIAAVGATPPQHWTARDVADALARLEVPGAACTWAHRFAPIWLLDAERDTCASEAWLYVDSATRDELRYQFREWTVDRLPPRPIACPSDGCVVCGVSRSPGRREAEAWAPAPTGKHKGHLCAACNQHRDTALGQSMIEACLADHLDPTREVRARHAFRQPTFGPIKLWVDTGLPPCSTRWGWLDLSHALDSGDW